MKSNLKYNWRITLGAPGHSISVVKEFCTFEQALIAVDKLETEIEWIVTRVSIRHEI